MRKIGSLLILIIAVSSLTAVFIGPAQAMYMGLTTQQTEEAIDYGQRNSMREVSDFIEEWSAPPVENKGFAFMITEFLALALESKSSAARGLPMTDFDIQDAIARSAGKLVFRVSTLGKTFDYSREYTAVVKTRDQVIQTTFWTNLEGEPLGDGTFVGDSDFYFPSDTVDPNGKITLIVQDNDGKPVIQFDFDLSKVR